MKAHVFILMQLIIKILVAVPTTTTKGDEMLKSQCLNCLHYKQQVINNEVWQLCGDYMGKNYFSYMILNGDIKCPFFHKFEVQNVQQSNN
jgi:hypothetical protein